MPGYGVPPMKCEPISDQEDSNSQITHSCLSTQLPSSVLLQSKLQSQRGNENVPGDLLEDLQGGGLEELAPLAPAGPAATPVCVKQERADTPPAATLETLQSATHGKASTSLDRRMGILITTEVPDSTDFIPLLVVKDEPLSEGEQQHMSGEDTSDSSGRQASPALRASLKSWTQQDMDLALDSLRNHQMSLTKAAATYGIPSTTLWQRAHRLGIDTPKKEGGAKSWRETDLRAALLALRAGAISANKASKAYGIPSSTLYKIARREGIRLSAPFNAAPTAWRRADLQLALAAIRAGAASVQRAASHYGIPTGTLYGRCKREGIELSRSNPTPWSEDAMGEALEAVRVGQMSINQAAIHYNLPYSSLYGRFKRCKYQVQGVQQTQQDIPKTNEMDMRNAPTDIPDCYQQLPSHTVHHHPEHEHTHVYMHPMRDYVHEAPVHVAQEQYGQAMYYNQGYSIATS